MPNRALEVISHIPLLNFFVGIGEIAWGGISLIVDKKRISEQQKKTDVAATKALGDMAEQEAKKQVGYLGQAKKHKAMLLDGLIDVTIIGRIILTTIRAIQAAWRKHKMKDPEYAAKHMPTQKVFEPTPLYDVKHLYDTMNVIHELFEKDKIPYIMTAGTLLGAIRHKGIIPWDDDGDLAVRLSDREAIMKLKPEFNKLGYEIREFRLGIKVYSKDAIRQGQESVYPSIDLFFKEKDSNGIWHHALKRPKEWWPKETFTDEEFEKRELVPFGPFKMYGPKNPERFLSTVYGDKWHSHAIRIWNHQEGKAFERQEVAITDKSPAKYTTTPFQDTLKAK